jgi:hypothetical protein
LSAARKTQAWSAPSANTAGNGRGFARLGPILLIASLVLLASMAFASGASAADGPPVVSPVTVTELGYTTAKVSATTESEPYYGENNATLYCFEYSLVSEPIDEHTKWGGGNETCYGKFGPGGKATLSDEFVKLKPNTTYRTRLGAFNGYGPTGFSLSYSPEPYTTFTTKPLNKPSGTVAISEVTLNSASITGTVSTDAPPGPLDATQKAAYRTEWQLVCRPACESGNGSSSGVVEGDETSLPFTWNAIRLETNTYYEVELIVTNGDGSQTTIIEEFFTTPNIAPKINPAPGGSSGTGAYSIGGVITPYNTKITDCHFEYGPTTEYVYSAPCSPQPVGRNEVQRFTIGATAGDFRLIFRGQETGDIPVGAEPKVVEEELQALSAIGPQGVTKVVREYGFFAVDYEVFFSGPLAGTNLNPIKVINGSPPIFVEGQGIPGCCTGDSLGFARSIVDGGNNDPVVVEAHLTGLTPGATYHYKVFATNSVGTVSSEDIRFVAPLAVGSKPCPNEAVRIENNSTRLPECRAYELVTTAFTTGYPAEMNKMSINEGTVSYNTKAGNINNSGWGGLFSNTYVAVRHDNGWSTIANLNGPRGSIFAPPNKLTTAYGPSQYSSDLLRSIWFLNKPDEKFDLWVGTPFLREDDGSFTKIGNPPRYFEEVFNYPYMGASEDLSHLFWIGDDYGADIWGPGVGNGLYQYAGTNNTGLPERIDLREDGTPISNCQAGPNSVLNAAYFDGYSSDGKTVWLTAKECEGHTAQIWVRVDMSKSYFASKSQCTRTAGEPGGLCNGEMSPEFERLSGDASRGLFTTNQQLLNSDTDQTKDLYEYVLPTASDPNPSPNLFQISGAAPNARVRNVVAVSNDGRRVYFIAQGVLASNHDAHDEPPHADDFNLYVWQQDAAHPDGYTQFVTRLEDPPQNYDVSAFGYTAQTTADGRYLVFSAYHPMVETDTDNSLDIYRYDAVTGEMARVSVDTAGVGGNTDFSNANLGTRYAVANNGQQIVFTTSEALSPEDGNGAPDAYLWQDGHTSLVSTGAVGGGASAVVIDGSGNDIYITSSQQLTSDDVDEVPDVFDVRRGGGFSFKETPPCAGEACQPAGTPAPDNGAPSTGQTGGGGNYQPATVSIKAMSASQRAKLAAGGNAEVPLKVSGPGKISLNGTARIGKRSAQVANATSRAVQPGIVTVPISLSSGALSQLRRKGTLSVQLSATVADSESATATLKLKTVEARRKRSKKGRG